MKSILLLFAAACAQNAPQDGSQNVTHGESRQNSTLPIQKPQLGAMLTRDREARPVFGVTGSVTLGNPLAPGKSSSSVVSMGCSQTTCLLKTESAIISTTGSSAGSTSAPPGPAIFSFDRAGALIYFPAVRQLARWRSAQVPPILLKVDLDVSGEILSIGNGLFAVRRDTGVWIVRSGDRLVESLPQSATSVLLVEGGVLFATQDRLVLRRSPSNSASNAPEQRFPVNSVQSLSWLGENYVQVATRDSNYALRIDPGHERIFLLPEPQRETMP